MRKRERSQGKEKKKGSKYKKRREELTRYSEEKSYRAKERTGEKRGYNMISLAKRERIQPGTKE